MQNLAVTTNTKSVTISRKRAQYFAISVLSEMKDYITAHRDEYDKWVLESEGEDYDGQHFCEHKRSS